MMGDGGGRHVDDPRSQLGRAAAQGRARGRQRQLDVVPVLAAVLADDAEVAQVDAAIGGAQARIVGGRPARSGHRVRNVQVELAGARQVDAQRHGLGAAIDLALQPVQFALRGRQLALQVLALLGDMPQAGQHAAERVGAERLDRLQFFQRRARAVLGRFGGASLHHRHQFALVVQHRRLVLERGLLALELADLFFQLLDAVVGRIGLEGVAHPHVQQGGLAAAFGRYLQRVLLQAGRQLFQHQFVLAGRQFAAGGAGDHGAILVDRDGVDGGGQSGGRGQTGKRGDGHSQESTLHVCTFERVAPAVPLSRGSGEAIARQFTGGGSRRVYRR